MHLRLRAFYDDVLPQKIELAVIWIIAEPISAVLADLS